MSPMDRVHAIQMPVESDGFSDWPCAVVTVGMYYQGGRCEKGQIIRADQGVVVLAGSPH